MDLMQAMGIAFSWVSHKLGLETVDRFPPGHPYARTRWNKAYFDIASDVAPDEIERRIADAISATPSVFAHIEHPTPRMQLALLDTIGQRLRRSCGLPLELFAMLFAAYESAHTREALPGLRQAIAANAGLDLAVRAQALLAFLNDHASAATIEA